MDWLIERQELLENRLAKRHLQAGAVALYDLSSSYFVSGGVKRRKSGGRSSLCQNSA
jgi:hypothetical protein